MILHDLTARAEGTPLRLEHKFICLYEMEIDSVRPRD